MSATINAVIAHVIIWVVMLRMHNSNAERPSCQLFWDGEQILYMGWHHTIKVGMLPSNTCSMLPACRVTVKGCTSYHRGVCTVVVAARTCIPAYTICCASGSAKIPSTAGGTDEAERDSRRGCPTHCGGGSVLSIGQLGCGKTVFTLMHATT